MLSQTVFFPLSHTLWITLNKCFHIIFLMDLNRDALVKECQVQKDQHPAIREYWVRFDRRKKRQLKLGVALALLSLFWSLYFAVGITASGFIYLAINGFVLVCIVVLYRNDSDDEYQLKLLEAKFDREGLWPEPNLSLVTDHKQDSDSTPDSGQHSKPTPDPIS